MATHSTAQDIHGHRSLQHHFENMEQQREAGTLGMWIFLVTEIMFFGGMFLAYTLYRSLYPAAFASASNHLDITLGAVNTAVLILSSFTMAMAVYFTQVGKRRPQLLCLGLTLILGLTFLGIKAVEYHDKYEDHLIPGRLIPGPSVEQPVELPAAESQTAGPGHEGQEEQEPTPGGHGSVLCGGHWGFEADRRFGRSNPA